MSSYLAERKALLDVILPITKLTSEQVDIQHDQPNIYSITFRVPKRYSCYLLKKISEQILEIFQDSDTVYIEYLYKGNRLYTADFCEGNVEEYMNMEHLKEVSLDER